MFAQKAACLWADAGSACPRMLSICWKDSTVDNSASDVRKLVSLDHDALDNVFDRLAHESCLASHHPQLSPPHPQNHRNDGQEIRHMALLKA